MPLGRPLQEDKLMYSRVGQFFNNRVNDFMLTELPHKLSFLKKKTSRMTITLLDLFKKILIVIKELI